MESFSVEENNTNVNLPEFDQDFKNCSNNEYVRQIDKINQSMSWIKNELIAIKAQDKEIRTKFVLMLQEVKQVNGETPRKTSKRSASQGNVFVRKHSTVDLLVDSPFPITDELFNKDKRATWII